MKKLYQILAVTSFSVILLVGTLIGGKTTNVIEANQNNKNEQIVVTTYKMPTYLTSFEIDNIRPSIQSNKLYIVGCAYNITDDTDSKTISDEQLNIEKRQNKQLNKTKSIVEEQLETTIKQEGEKENKQINEPINEDVIEKPSYTEEELETFAHLLFAEAGSDKCSDTTIYYVGSVVLNRVKSDKYPNTLLEVIYQKGQYSPTWHGFMKKTPTERCYTIAKDLLENGSIIPDGVLGQADYKIYKKYGSALYEKKDGIYFFYIK